MAEKTAQTNRQTLRT